MAPYRLDPEFEAQGYELALGDADLAGETIFDPELGLAPGHDPGTGFELGFDQESGDGFDGESGFDPEFELEFEADADPEYGVEPEAGYDPEFGGGDVAAEVIDPDLVSHRHLGRGRVVQQEAGGASAPPRHAHLGVGRVVPRGASAAEFELEPEIIPPTDDRVRVTDTKPVPYRFICCLDLFFRDPDNPANELLFRGSGTLVGPRHVLTAAHCLYDTVRGSRGTQRKAEVARIVVTPGRNGAAGTAAARAPLGSAPSRSVHYTPAWRSSQSPSEDYGLIVLARAIGEERAAALGRQLGWWGHKTLGGGTRIRALEPAKLRNIQANVCGYPADKCGALPARGSATAAMVAACATDRWASTQWRSFDRITAVAPGASRVIQHRMDTKGGHSGSPIWVRWQDVRILTAVHTGFNQPPLINRGVRLTVDALNNIRTWSGAAVAVS